MKEAPNHYEEKKHLGKTVLTMLFPEKEMILGSWIQTRRYYGLEVSLKMIKCMAKNIQIYLYPEVSLKQAKAGMNGSVNGTTSLYRTDEISRT